MLAVAKTPHINLRIEGEIPNKLLKILCLQFGKKLKITNDDNDEQTDIFQTAWYKERQEKMTHGKTVKIYRENFKWTLEHLGEKLGGLSRQYVSDIEHDRRPISKDLAKKMAALFDAPLEQFI